MYKLTKKGKILIGILTIIILIIFYSIYIKNTEEENIEYFESEEELDKQDTEEKIEKKEIVVHIAGCVMNPGIVKLEENSRICDAIDMAGGVTNDADISKINLAYTLEDGMKIYVPSINEQEINEENIEQSTNSQINEKINLNNANKLEIEKIPGIGTITAQKIIDYRKENGKFKSIEDIKNVKGIGENKFEKIKEYICVK